MMTGMTRDGLFTDMGEALDYIVRVSKKYPRGWTDPLAVIVHNNPRALYYTNYACKTYQVREEVERFITLGDIVTEVGLSYVQEVEGRILYTYHPLYRVSYPRD